jgi:hypothetical protein
VPAAVLIAGDGRSAFRSAGCALGEVALWAFHRGPGRQGALAGTTELIANLMACPSPPRKPTRMTIYPGVGHNAWTRTYDLSAGHEIYAWLLGFTR